MARQKQKNKSNKKLLTTLGILAGLGMLGTGAYALSKRKQDNQTKKVPTGKPEKGIERITKETTTKIKPEGFIYGVTGGAVTYRSDDEMGKVEFGDEVHEFIKRQEGVKIKKKDLAPGYNPRNPHIYLNVDNNTVHYRNLASLHEIKLEKDNKGNYVVKSFIAGLTPSEHSRIIKEMEETGTLKHVRELIESSIDNLDYLKKHKKVPKEARVAIEAHANKLRALNKVLQELEQLDYKGEYLPLVAGVKQQGKKKYYGKIYNEMHVKDEWEVPTVVAKHFTPYGNQIPKYWQEPTTTIDVRGLNLSNVDDLLEHVKKIYNEALKDYQGKYGKEYM